ncbi:MAG: nuclear transport factor 2 family protein [Acidimicrobiia bacterium]|nr:nuclear transport factor 2 family protein [Acidimicrobiia bacterium]
MTDAEVVRAMYDVLAAADIRAFTDLLDPDIEWTVPGRHTLSGTTVGVAALLAHLAEVAQRTGGHVSVDVREVLTGEAYVTALVDVEMTVDDHTVQDRQVHVFQVRDGRIASVREYHGDVRAFEELFGTP